MLFKFIKGLSQRTQNIIGAILNILVLTAISSVLICIVFGAIGNLADVSIMISLAGLCFFIFLITLGILSPVFVIVLISLIIDAFKRDGFKRLFKRLFKTFTVPFSVVIVFFLIKYKHFEWIKSIFYSFMITLLQFVKAEVDTFIEERGKEHPL